MAYMVQWVPDPSFLLLSLYGGGDESDVFVWGEDVELEIIHPQEKQINV